ncbi:hypothetical protein Tcan_10206 [Toxocara canis]|uniref:Uncharacterized protein n=1 Tax=Toxocara canis TaxID=6265 RepID=A0A0B2UTI7_TOXCA|nr:hypothetical protein Tcan_10206 [Toxocara canis]
MEALYRAYANGKEFIKSVIEWRSAATAPYFMLINTAFWWSVFYMREEVQQRLLISLATGIFGWDILLSASHEHSVLVHLILWPVHDTLRTASVVLALLGAYSLHHAELEKACWMAYSTVVLLMLNPVWHYQKVPEKVNRIAYSGYCITKKAGYDYAVCPTVAVYKCAKYIILFQWVSAFVDYMKRFFYAVARGLHSLWITFVHFIANIWSSIRFWTVAKIRAIRDAIVNFLCAIKDWIVTKVRAFRDGIRAGISAVFNSIRNAIVAIGRWIRNKVIATGKWIRDTVFAIGAWIRAKVVAFHDWIRAILAALKNWLYTRIVYPVKQRALAVGRFLRFWLCAHWWPRLKHSFIEEIGIPLQRGFNYFCYYLIYVFCGHWIRPFGRFIREQLYIFSAYLQRTLFVPLKRWAKARLDDLYVAAKKLLHKLAIAIRDSVIWPFCVVFGGLLKQAYDYVHRTVLQPFYDLLYEKYKIGEDYVYINILGPACQTIVNNIPEKSPFCDDSDTELAGLLPSHSVDEYEGNNTDTEGTSDRPSLPSGSLTPLTEDEREFLIGLKFPTVEASESSDEEFDLRKPRKRSKNAKAIPKDPAPSADGMQRPSESSNGNADNCLQHRLSLSSTSSLSDGAGSMSSTRSDALLNAKLSFGDSNSDGDPERYPSRHTSEGEKHQNEPMQGSSTESLTRNKETNAVAESGKTPVGVVKASGLVDTDSSNIATDRSGGATAKPPTGTRSEERRTVSSSAKKRSESQGSKTRKRNSAPSSTSLVQSHKQASSVDEQFEILDITRLK